MCLEFLELLRGAERCQRLDSRVLPFSGHRHIPEYAQVMPFDYPQQINCFLEDQDTPYAGTSGVSVGHGVATF